MSERWRIVIGSDDAGVAYRDAIGADLEADPRVAEVVDVGVPTDESTPYLRVALTAARTVTEGRADRALLICGAGLCVAMSANKVPGIRAVTASDSSSVKRSVLDDDAQVLCFGQQVIGLDLARQLAREWLSYRFGNRSSTTATQVYENDAHPRYRGRSRLDDRALHPPVVGGRVDPRGSERSGRLRSVVAG
jgi:ribose 5-phosphate isomerase B